MDDAAGLGPRRRRALTWPKLRRVSAPLLDFWFDYSCPYAYLGSLGVFDLAARHGATLRLRPFLLGGVFRALGTPQNLFATLSPPKTAHNARDLERWAAAVGEPLTMPADHPLRTVEALRATIATNVDPRVVRGFYRAYWVENRPISDRAVIADVLRAAGHDPEPILARLEDASLKDDLRARTDEALALGIFGAPAYQVNGGPIVWGQDRVPFVALALGAPRADLTTSYPLPEPPPSSSTPRRLEIYWDFSSPYSYLGATQAKRFAAETGATLIWRPMLLGAVFKAIGQADLPMATFSEPKRAYVARDMHDWARYWDVPFRFPSLFPMNSVKALRAWIATPPERQDEVRERIYRAYWAEDRNIGDEAVLAELIGDDAAEILAQSRTPEVKNELFAATDRAVKAGVFGAPTWVVDGAELFFGQDRLPLVKRALLG